MLLEKYTYPFPPLEPAPERVAGKLLMPFSNTINSHLRVSSRWEVNMPNFSLPMQPNIERHASEGGLVSSFMQPHEYVDLAF